MLKDQPRELDGHFFGEEFESKLIKDSKALKKMKTVFTGLQGSSNTSRKKDGVSNNKQPFRKGPVFRGRDRGFQQGISHFK